MWPLCTATSDREDSSSLHTPDMCPAQSASQPAASPREEPKLLLACKAAQAWHRATDGEGECRQLRMTCTQRSTNQSGNAPLKLHLPKPQDGRGETSSLVYSASRAGISPSDAEAGTCLCYLTALLWYPCCSLALQIILNSFKARLFITFISSDYISEPHDSFKESHI